MAFWQPLHLLSISIPRNTNKFGCCHREYRAIGTRNHIKLEEWWTDNTLQPVLLIFIFHHSAWSADCLQVCVCVHVADATGTINVSWDGIVQFIINNYMIVKMAIIFAFIARASGLVRWTHSILPAICMTSTGDWCSLFIKMIYVLISFNMKSSIRFRP